MKLEDKVAIVTGAGMGMGRAIAITLAKEGSDVVIADVDIQSGESVAQEVKALGRRALALKVDVSRAEDVNKMVEKTLATFSKIDILVNNAGISKVVPAVEESEAHWDKMIGINLKGQFLCCQAVGKQMTRQKRGKIVNIASTAAHRAMIGMVTYSASKGGVIALSRVLAAEWAKYNVNVNIVSPGWTWTPMNEKIAQESPDFAKDRIKLIPLQRGNKPEDIANAVLFLVSPESDNVTGQEIIVDGGSCCIHPATTLAL